jgi:hypothetical protein
MTSMNLGAKSAVHPLRARRIGAFERRQQALALVIARLHAGSRGPHVVGRGSETSPPRRSGTGLPRRTDI